MARRPRTAPASTWDSETEPASTSDSENTPRHDTGGALSYASRLQGLPYQVSTKAEQHVEWPGRRWPPVGQCSPLHVVSSGDGHGCGRGRGAAGARPSCGHVRHEPHAGVKLVSSVGRSLAVRSSLWDRWGTYACAGRVSGAPHYVRAR
eukprot:scaffold29371_cov101-Isochrysis_galbana.AAC.1